MLDERHHYVHRISGRPTLGPRRSAAARVDRAPLKYAAAKPFGRRMNIDNAYESLDLVSGLTRAETLIRHWFAENHQLSCQLQTTCRSPAMNRPCRIALATALLAAVLLPAVRAYTRPDQGELARWMLRTLLHRNSQ